MTTVSVPGDITVLLQYGLTDLQLQVALRLWMMQSPATALVYAEQCQAKREGGDANDRAVSSTNGC